MLNKMEHFCENICRTRNSCRVFREYMCSSFFIVRETWISCAKFFAKTEIYLWENGKGGRFSSVNFRKNLRILAICSGAKKRNHYRWNPTFVPGDPTHCCLLWPRVKTLKQARTLNLLLIADLRQRVSEGRHVITSRKSTNQHFNPRNTFLNKETWKRKRF